MMSTRSQGTETHGIWREFWGALGGWHAIPTSGYFWAAVGVTIATAHRWINSEWWQDSIGVLPNLLGFTLGGYAIFLGVTEPRFVQALADKDEADGETTSPLVEIGATFAYFILVQAVALVYALVAQALYFPLEPNGPMLSLLGDAEPSLLLLLDWARTLGWALGYFLFAYALTLAIAATMAVFRMVRWFDTFLAGSSEE